MEGTASASPGLRQIVSRAPANSACRGRGPRPRRYAGGSVAPTWRPRVLRQAACCCSPLLSSGLLLLLLLRLSSPLLGSAAAAAAAPLLAPVSVGRTIPPPSSAAGAGRPAAAEAAAAAAEAAAGLQQLRPLPERHMGIGHWAYWALGARHWALGTGHWHALGTGWAHCVKSAAWSRGRTRAPRVKSQLRSAACEGRRYSPLTHRRHSSAAHDPSCLPQRLCASACRSRARRGPRWPDGHTRQ